MDLKNLSELIKTLRKLGVSHFKNAEIELTLDLSKGNRIRSSRKKTVSLPEGFSAEPNKAVSPMLPLEQMTEEQFLYWSSGFDPEEIKAQSPKTSQENQ